MDTVITFIIGVIVGLLLFWFFGRRGMRGEVEQLRAEGESARRQLADTKRALQEATAARAQELPRSTKDDLTRIHGIGPVFQRKLNEAGIHTFAQLSKATPDHLAGIVSVPEWQKIEPERWVTDAAQMAQGG